MIKVYFESKSHAELVATFEDEEIYLKCLPILSDIATENNMFVIESVEYDN